MMIINEMYLVTRIHFRRDPLLSLNRVRRFVTRPVSLLIQGRVSFSDITL